MTSTIIYHHTPYVYVIRHIPSGKFYAGSRTAKGCHPSDFWSKYFTSSKYVKELINIDGHDSFVLIDIIECIDASSALNLESKLLKAVSASTNKSWLNLTNGDGNFSIAGHLYSHSTETKTKMSLAKKGKARKPFSEEHRSNLSTALKGKTSAALKGRLFSYDHISNLSKSQIGKTHTPERRANMSIAAMNRPKVSCVYCHKVVSNNIFTRYHGERCKSIRMCNFNA